MKKRNAHHGPPIDAYIIPDTDEHQVINNKIHNQTMSIVKYVSLILAVVQTLTVYYNV